ncbi:putative CXXCH cytochrome family protein [Edaphobacter modestus]|uniref:Putative CXXCH cytochrome family protein n=2 Tax=Edaphobacter modestus TaxID=388466 RepID=A0A4Q7YX61_9BACT|nr:putative CXXCH cytochrome family protein [Edaphobacter modestus]
MLCAVVAAAVLAWHLVGEKPHTVETKGSTVTQLNTGYVDAQACATCHGTIAKTFKKTGMGRSFYRPTTENVIEDYEKANTFVHKASGLRYRMIERDGKFYERRFTLGKDGKEENVLEERIDYVMGSGNQARTYMHRTSQGKLVELPVSWYTERSGYWNMSPGFDRADHPDMHGAIGPECMFCHNGYPQLTDSSQAALEESIFPEKLPEGIDCQRCHGPGAAHVAAASGGKATLPEIRSKIVNPAKLPRDRQMEVCMECHMETSARHVPSAIRAYGRELYSFRPGEPLGDYRTYFERPKDPKSDDYEVAHAGYQLVRSACFRNTQMTCLTCHNPHDIPRGEAAKKQYIAVCETCHKQVSHKGVAMTAGNDCLSCHMPKRRTEGSVHIVLTDHYIQRVCPARDLTAPFPESLLPEDLTPVQIYYPRSTQPTAREQLLLAVAKVNDAGIDGIGQLRAQLDRQHPQWPEPYVALGTGYARAGKTEDAVRSFNQALKFHPDDRAALRELSAALLSGGQVERAVEILERATGIYPEDDGMLANLANAYLRQGKLSEAQDAISRTLAINPDRAEVHDLAGLVAIKRQDGAAAEQSFREAIQLKPNLAAPQNNLANLLVGEHRYPEAEAYFRRALELKPDYGDAHHGLGLLMILERNNAEATHELQEAARTAPTDPEVHTDLADLLSAQGRFADAAAEYRRALALQSGRPDANLGLGLALLRQGQREEAFRYIQIAAHSSDAEVSQHAQGILGQVLR